MGAVKNSRPTIGWAAREAGVHVETVRYYERLGLIARPPARRGYREYPEETVQRIRFIKRAQEFGFTLREIAELAHQKDGGASCQEMCTRVEAKIGQLDAEIARLTELRDQLKQLVGASPKTPARGSHADCAVLGRMASISDCGEDCGTSPCVHGTPVRRRGSARTGGFRSAR